MGTSSRFVLTASALLVAAFATGCATSNGDSPDDAPTSPPARPSKSNDDDGPASTSSNTDPAPSPSAPNGDGEADKDGTASCTPKTCATLGETCGKHQDGCGGEVDCGACANACKPKTCTELGKSCGKHPDGCGGERDCGACAATCTGGSGGTTPQTALDLGATTDSPDTKKTAYEEALNDAQEDWFKSKVTDGGYDGNPRITASVARSVEVSLFYVCDNGGDASYCTNAVDSPDTTIGKGCKGTSSAQVKVSCSGISDNGTAYIRVRKLASDGQCVSYSVDLFVD